MSKELIKKITDTKESVAAFFTLCNERESVQAELIKRLDSQLDGIANAIGRSTKRRTVNCTRYTVASFSPHLGLITISSESSASSVVGTMVISSTESPREITANHVRYKQSPSAAFEKEFSFPSEKSNDWWPAWAWWDDPYRSWGGSLRVNFSGQFAGELKAKLEKLAKIARQVCPD